MACSCILNRKDLCLAMENQNIFTISKETQVSVPALSNKPNQVPNPSTHIDSLISCYSNKSADITAHHTGYHKLVERPLEPAIAIPGQTPVSSKPLQQHNLLEQHHLSANSSTARGKNMEEITTTSKDQYRKLLRSVLSETIGTAYLVLFGCAGCISFTKEHSPLQGPLAFGFIIATIIQTFGHISGAHLNPAVSAAAFVLGHINWRHCIIYCLAQCIGAVLGYGLLKLITPARILLEQSVDGGFCMTLPNGEVSHFQAFLTELLATSMLIFLLCSALDHRTSKSQGTIALNFGLCIVAVAIALGAYSGSSMNPARSFGPAFWNWNFYAHWIYWVAPMLSAFVTAGFYRVILYEQEKEKMKVSKDRFGGELPLRSADDGQSYV